jgi:hypothetical protein
VHSQAGLAANISKQAAASRPRGSNSAGGSSSSSSGSPEDDEAITYEPRLGAVHQLCFSSQQTVTAVLSSMRTNVAARGLGDPKGVGRKLGFKGQLQLPWTKAADILQASTSPGAVRQEPG